MCDLLAVERIRAGVEAALQPGLSRCRLPVPGHFCVELRYKNHADAYHASFFKGASLKEPHIVRSEVDDYFEVLRFFSFCVA
jgi:D-amino peptidase